MNKIALALLVSIPALALAGCSKDGDLDLSSGVGISKTRTGCPVVAVADGTGDITLFNPADSQDASAIDVVATITNVRPACNGAGEKIYSEATFDVLASRTDVRGARTVTLPYFSTIVQGGTAVVAKRLSNVTISFADGQTRASGTGKVATFVDGAAARLPADIIERINRKRRPGDSDAALDPMQEPEVRAAVLRSTFEMLVGFQLTADQLRYNVTR